MRPAFTVLAALGLLLATVGTTTALAQTPAPAPATPGAAPAAQTPAPAASPQVATTPAAQPSPPPASPTPAGPAPAPPPPGPNIPGAARAPGLPAQVAIAQLVGERNAFIRGDVLLEQNAAGATAVTVTVYGLEPGSTHVNHIHRGSCTGPVLFPLRDLVADRSGVARAVSTVRAPIDLENWWVNAHAGPALPSPGITCGRVEPPPVVPAGVVGVRFSEPPIIPEADSLALVGAGLVLLGAVAAWRARRT